MYSGCICRLSGDSDIVDLASFQALMCNRFTYNCCNIFMLMWCGHIAKFCRQKGQKHKSAQIVKSDA